LCKNTILIFFHIGFKAEAGDYGFKFCAIGVPLHRKCAVHGAEFAADLRTRNVLMPLARLQYGLYAYYAFALYFALFARSICDVPPPSQELYGVRAVVFYGDAVGEKVVAKTRFGDFALVLRFYAYPYIVGDGGGHIGEIKD
jgi:hypothetical protein